VKDPSVWISNECVPDGFEWKDPSKIQIGEVFRLLYHWMDRHVRGLDPLIWLPTCPIFQEEEQCSKHGRNIRQARARQPQLSDEEEFGLPQSDHVDEEENMENSDNTETSDKSPTDGSSSEHAESIDLNKESPLMHVSQQEQGSPGEFMICYVSLLFISHVPYYAPSPEDGGKSASPQYEHSHVYRSFRPGQYFIHILSMLLICPYNV
jgi:hypothetical protein